MHESRNQTSQDIKLQKSQTRTKHKGDFAYETNSAHNKKQINTTGFVHPIKLFICLKGNIYMSLLYDHIYF